MKSEPFIVDSVYNVYNFWVIGLEVYHICPSYFPRITDSNFQIKHRD